MSDPTICCAGELDCTFTSFRIEPLCARIVAGDEVDVPYSRDWIRRRDSVLPVEPSCPVGCAKICTGGGFRRAIRPPHDAYRIEWFALSANATNPDLITIDDVRRLPVKPPRR